MTSKPGFVLYTVPVGQVQRLVHAKNALEDVSASAMDEQREALLARRENELAGARAELDDARKLETDPRTRRIVLENITDYWRGIRRTILLSWALFIPVGSTLILGVVQGTAPPLAAITASSVFLSLGISSGMASRSQVHQEVQLHHRDKVRLKRYGSLLEIRKRDLRQIFRVAMLGGIVAGVSGAAATVMASGRAVVLSVGLTTAFGVVHDGWVGLKAGRHLLGIRFFEEDKAEAIEAAEQKRNSAQQARDQAYTAEIDLDDPIDPTGEKVVEFRRRRKEHRGHQKRTATLALRPDPIHPALSSVLSGRSPSVDEHAEIVCFVATVRADLAVPDSDERPFGTPNRVDPSVISTCIALQRKAGIHGGSGLDAYKQDKAELVKGIDARSPLD